MALRRIKDRWHNSTPENTGRDVQGEKTTGDQASALAYIIWKLALNGAINLHAEDFRYDDDQQRIAVISELLAFQVQHVDRLSHIHLIDEQLQEGSRALLLQQLCERIADQMQDNLTDIAGPGNYRLPFTSLLNERFAVYAEFDYRGTEPGYQALRYLGHSILGVMGEDQTNRWVIDQIIEIDAPELIDQVTRSTRRLFGWESPDQALRKVALKLPDRAARQRHPKKPPDKATRETGR